MFGAVCRRAVAATFISTALRGHGEGENAADWYRLVEAGRDAVCRMCHMCESSDHVIVARVSLRFAIRNPNQILIPVGTPFMIGIKGL